MDALHRRHSPAKSSNEEYPEGRATRRLALDPPMGGHYDPLRTFSAVVAPNAHWSSCMPGIRKAKPAVTLTPGPFGSDRTRPSLPDQGFPGRLPPGQITCRRASLQTPSRNESHPKGNDA